MDSISIPRSINLLVITSLVPFLDKYPELKDLLQSSKYPEPAMVWDYFMTVAGTGLFLLTHKMSEVEYSQIIADLLEVDRKGLQGIENYMEFMKIDQENEIDYKVRTGVWVLFSIKGEFPSQDEMGRVAPAIGSYLSNLTEDKKVSKKFKVVLLDATDAYYYADVMDNMEEFDTVEDLDLAKSLADSLFIVKNYKWKSLADMNDVDGGWDVRVYDEDMNCIYKAHEKYKDKWFY